MKTEERRRAQGWPEEDQAIASLAEQATPLNDRFAEGKDAHLSEVLRYICALERRVAELEQQGHP